MGAVRFLNFLFRFALFCFVFLFFVFSLVPSFSFSRFFSFVGFRSPSRFPFLFVFVFSLSVFMFFSSPFFLFSSPFFSFSSPCFSPSARVPSLVLFLFVFLLGWALVFFSPVSSFRFFSFFSWPCFTPCVFRGFISCLDYHRMIIDIGFRCRFAYRVFIMQLSLSFCVLRSYPVLTCHLHVYIWF